MGEQPSGILRWTVLKTVLYRIGEAVFSYTAVNCSEDCIIQFFGGLALFLNNAVDSIEDCFIQDDRGGCL